MTVDDANDAKEFQASQADVFMCCHWIDHAGSLIRQSFLVVDAHETIYDVTYIYEFIYATHAIYVVRNPEVSSRNPQTFISSLTRHGNCFFHALTPSVATA